MPPPWASANVFHKYCASASHSARQQLSRTQPHARSSSCVNSTFMTTRGGGCHYSLHFTGEDMAEQRGSGTCLGVGGGGVVQLVKNREGSTSMSICKAAVLQSASVKQTV